MTKLLDCDLEVDEFEWQSRYYTHFHPLENYKAYYRFSYGLNDITEVLL